MFVVTSLYTNVPVKEARQKAADRLYSGDVQASSVDKETFISLAIISCTNLILSTHDAIYWQIDGLAIGSPPGPPLSNIWLSKYEPAIKNDVKLFEDIWMPYLEQSRRVSLRTNYLKLIRCTQTRNLH